MEVGSSAGRHLQRATLMKNIVRVTWLGDTWCKSDESEVSPKEQTKQIEQPSYPGRVI